MWVICGQTRQVLDLHGLRLDCPFSQQALEINQINYLARKYGNFGAVYQIAAHRWVKHAWWG
jgi:hypothetical protein